MGTIHASRIVILAEIAYYFLLYDRLTRYGRHGIHGSQQFS